VRLDELIGPRFALLAWATNPDSLLSPQARSVLARLDARRFMAVPMTQLQHAAALEREVTVVGDAQSRLKDWFDARDESVVLLRPDRIVAVACQPAELDASVHALAGILGLTPNTSPQGACV
jgi:3-(3-hydroxy-phenyl)propionate hydroxylase